MDEQVTRELSDVLATAGPSVCTTPRVLGILLRQRCPQAEAQISELEQALTSGCVRPILDSPESADLERLAAQLAERSGMELSRAHWAITTWAHALAKAERAGPTPLGRDWSSWNKLDVSGATAGGSGAYQRSLGHLALVGAAGAVGGAGLGFYLLLRGEWALIEPWRVALEDLAPWLRVVALVVLGGLGGGAGGLLGWIFGGGQSWTYIATGGTTLGRLAFSALGAFHGAGVGVMVGLGVAGLMGILPGGLLGAGVGSFLGLLVAEQIARFWT